MMVKELEKKEELEEETNPDNMRQPTGLSTMHRRLSTGLVDSKIYKGVTIENTKN